MSYNEEAAEFEEYLGLMNELLEKAMDIVRRQGGMTLKRAELYWYPSIRGMIDPNATPTSMYPMFTALTELLESDDPDNEETN